MRTTEGEERATRLQVVGERRVDSPRRIDTVNMYTPGDLFPDNRPHMYVGQ
jgi:hypothetical protein